MNCATEPDRNNFRISCAQPGKAVPATAGVCAVLPDAVLAEGVPVVGALTDGVGAAVFGAGAGTDGAAGAAGGAGTAGLIGVVSLMECA
jgi:hypothetical protein